MYPSLFTTKQHPAFYFIFLFQIFNMRKWLIVCWLWCFKLESGQIYMALASKCWLANKVLMFFFLLSGWVCSVCVARETTKHHVLVHHCYCLLVILDLMFAWARRLLSFFMSLLPCSNMFGNLPLLSFLFFSESRQFVRCISIHSN